MEHIYFFILLTFSTISSAQIITIPDANFKFALVNYFIADLDNSGNFGYVVDANGDGEIQVSEAVAVYGLELNGMSINSLEGIHEFTNIIRLLCANNNLIGIDISQNLNLEELTATANQLNSLDVTQNTNLETLICDNNEFLTGVNVSQNSSLTYLTCSNNPLLTSLNIKNGNNINLTPMDASGNPMLTCINVDDEIYANSNPIAWMKDSTAEYSENCVLGIENYNDVTFSMFPNPARNVLNINLQQGQIIDGIKIFSIDGVLVKETSSLLVNVSQFSSGLYLAEIVINGKRNVKKFIKL